MANENIEKVKDTKKTLGLSFLSHHRSPWDTDVSKSDRSAGGANCQRMGRDSEVVKITLPSIVAVSASIGR